MHFHGIFHHIHQPAMGYPHDHMETPLTFHDIPSLLGFCQAHLVVLQGFQVILPFLCSCLNGGFHKWGYPQNGWFMMEHAIKMDDWEVPLSSPILENHQMLLAKHVPENREWLTNLISVQIPDASGCHYNARTMERDQSWQTWNAHIAHKKIG